MFAKKKYPPLVSGRPVKFRRFQQLIWVGMSALLGAGFIAGLYYLGFQEDYHNLIPSLPKGTSAKTWWDSGMGFIHSAHWPDDRHALRNLGEPALWVMVGATLLGKARTHPRFLLPPWALVLAPLVLLVMLIAGAVGIAWVTVQGPLSHVSNIFSWQDLVLGGLLGQVLHRFWSPIGSTIRYLVVARAVRTGRTPLWVTLPLMPPAWREMYSELDREDTNPPLPKEKRTGLKRLVPPQRVLVPVMLLVFTVIAVVGNLAKYVIAHGGHVPGMTS